MLTKVFLLLATAIALVLLIAAFKSGRFRISRHIAISASPGAAFALVNDYHRWPVWSPYEKLDPAMQRSYLGNAAGPGAIYQWSGNAKAGAGRITILESRPDERIRMKLEMTKPFPCANEVVFTFAPVAGQTQVTWTMSGENGFPSRVFTLFVSMDKLVGGEFERGLSQLKAAAEATP